MKRISSYRSPKIQAREGSLAGKGAFAIAPIKKDEIVWIRSGHIITLDEGSKLDDRLLGYTVQIQDDFLLSASNQQEVGDFVIHFNHSCEPNVGLCGEITYVAMHDIRPGEELTVDYALFISRDFRLECRCKSSKCRGVITGNDWKLAELRRLYQGYFAYYIQKKHMNM